MVEVEIRETGGPPRVLVVGLDGGACYAILATERSLEVSMVPSFAEVDRALAKLRPDAVVVALGQAEGDHARAVKELREASPLPILIVSEPADERRITELIKAGAGGYLLTEDVPRVAGAVRELLRGGVPMSEPVSRLVLGRARRSSTRMAAVLPSTPAADQLLTPRQREILKLLAHGHSYEGIGIALNLSVNTVRSHVRVIYDRLGASTKVEAVVAAIELRIIDRDPIR